MKYEDYCVAGYDRDAKLMNYFQGDFRRIHAVLFQDFPGTFSNLSCI